MLCPLKSADDYITCDLSRHSVAIMLCPRNPKGFRSVTEVPLLKNCRARAGILFAPRPHRTRIRYRDEPARTNNPTTALLPSCTRFDSSGAIGFLGKVYWIDVRGIRAGPISKGARNHS